MINLVHIYYQKLSKDAEKTFYEKFFDDDNKICPCISYSNMCSHYQLNISKYYISI